MSITCQCKDTTLIQPNDGTGTLFCPQCSRMWHMCRKHPHQPVAGPGNSPTQMSCTCSLSSSPPLQWCPRCKSTKVNELDFQTTSRRCADCSIVFHMCPVHNIPVMGAGYTYTSVDMHRCHCHISSQSFAKWQSPFL